MSERKEWEARRRKLEQEVELLTQEADFIHYKLVEAWASGDPAFSLNRRDREVNAKLNDAVNRLALNTRTEPKEENTGGTR